MKHRPALRAALRGAAQLLLALFALSLAVFCISRAAPGDPLRSWYGDGAERMNEAQRAAALHKLGLDRPLPAQYGVWLQNALRGEFGLSLKYKRDVAEVIGGVWKNTLLLGGLSYLLTFALALPLGALCALHEDRPLDRALCKAGTVATVIPSFWVSLLLLLAFSVGLGWLPAGGAYEVGRAGDLPGRARHLVLPLAALVLGHLWYYACLARNKLLEEVRRDYVLLCKMKGLSRRRIVWGHCVPNILPSYVGLMAASIPHILGGTYVVETVFSYPGLGTLSFESARYHDYNLLLALCLLTGALVVLGSLLAQVVGARIDPRMRREGRPPDAEG